MSNKDNKAINVLLLSVGTRNKVVRYFKNEFLTIGKIVATDMSNLAPAIYEADKFYIVPSITATNYMEVIIDICIKERITGVLSFIDPELSLLAKHKKQFDDIGVQIVGSPYAQCEMALNKMHMFEWLKSHGYYCAESYMSAESFYRDIENNRIRFPVFVKPVQGSASIAVSKVVDKDTVDLLFQNNANLMIQEYLNGQEIGADVYIDLISHEVVSIFTKKKIAMRAGETDKAVSFKDQKLFALIERFVQEAGFCGQIDIDIFAIGEDYYISEVNPRFGGGYPHAYECGCNHVQLIKNNLNGIVNSKQIGNYDSGIYMMKYNEVKVLDKV